MAKFNKKTVEDLAVAGKRVLVRCDFNVPLKEGVITDDTRIRAALPTIQYLLKNDARVILCSHMGKPKGQPKAELSLAPVAVRLSELLGAEVKFAADDEVVGENARAAVAAMQNGEAVLLQNTRFRPEEEKNVETFSKELGELCDLFVNDAFGAAHRAHCSTVGVASFVEEAANGYLMAKEVEFLGNAVENPERPFVCILGGAKVADKLAVIENLLTKADTLIVGGGMAYTFIKAQGGEIGTFVTVGCPFTLSNYTPTYGPCPTLGGNTDEVLASLGYTAEQIASFKTNGTTAPMPKPAAAPAAK